MDDLSEYEDESESEEMKGRHMDGRTVAVFVVVMLLHRSHVVPG